MFYRYRSQSQENAQKLFRILPNLFVHDCSDLNMKFSVDVDVKWQKVWWRGQEWICELIFWDYSFLKIHSKYAIHYHKINRMFFMFSYVIEVQLWRKNTVRSGWTSERASSWKYSNDLTWALADLRLDADIYVEHLQSRFNVSVRDTHS
jgi:hypothetical protein